MTEYKPGDEVKWTYNNVREKAPAFIVAGPFMKDAFQHYVIAEPQCPDHYYVREDRLRPKPKPPEYEYGMDVAEGGNHGEIKSTVWSPIRPALACVRREVGKPETIEWITNDT